MPLEDEAAEQCLLHHPLSAHHRPNLLHPAEEKSAPGAPIKQSFSGNLRIPAGWSRRLADGAGHHRAATSTWREVVAGA
jgi:hypothetical protein